MNRIMNMKKSVLMTALMAVISLGFMACSDSDSGGGQPEITGVRVCDPAKADSLFTKSSQGQVIAIIGNTTNKFVEPAVSKSKTGTKQQYNY